MAGPKFPGFDTLSLHAGQSPDPATGSRAVPIYQTTSYVFPDTDTASSIFNLERGGHAYSRITNPTVAVLEQVTTPNKIKKVLKTYDLIKRMIYQGRGLKARALFDRENLPRKEQAIRNPIKRAGLWLR